MYFYLQKFQLEIPFKLGLSYQKVLSSLWYQSELQYADISSVYAFLFIYKFCSVYSIELIASFSCPIQNFQFNYYASAQSLNAFNYLRILKQDKLLPIFLAVISITIIIQSLLLNSILFYSAYVTQQHQYIFKMEPQKEQYLQSNPNQSQVDPYEFPQQLLQSALEKIYWQDIIPQQAKKHDTIYEIIVPLQHRKHYQNLHYLLQKGQISIRSSLLSLYLLCVRTSNYYALMLRKDCYQHFQSKKQKTTDSGNLDNQNDFVQFDLKTQLHFMNCLLNNNPKEYHIWNYKKQLILKKISSEQLNIHQQQIYQSQSKFLDVMLANDSKNYHAWDYKFWLTVNLYNSLDKIDEQISKTDSLIFSNDGNSQNMKNNINKDCYSLWSYRFNLLKIKSNIQQKEATWEEIRSGLVKNIKKQILLNQVNVVLPFIKLNPYNECGWNYLTGIIYCYDESNDIVIIKSIEDQVLDLKSHFYNKINAISDQLLRQKEEINLRFLFTCLLTVKQIEIRHQDSEQKKAKLKQDRRQIIIELKRIDYVRQLYYNFLLENQSD